ncbi:MAG: DUF3326 domain-containing protein [Syntrophales bacterium]|nr:DUF3326 domain-containing protein [Syntrophales bacterium]
MILYEKEITVPLVGHHERLLDHLSEVILERLPRSEIPVRVAVTLTDEKGYHCELGILSGADHFFDEMRGAIFQFQRRGFENTGQFNAVLIVPTGVGAEIGGHSGDAGSVARLLASACDNLITHPNVVNASDINELPENGLYVEGSVLARFLMGTVSLQKVRANRVLLVIDKHADKFFYESAVNSASAARSSLGLDCPGVVMLEDKMLMRSLYSSSGRAVGKIDYFERVYDVLTKYRPQYDAVALSSVIKVPENFHTDYYLKDMINPWGGVEAMLTHAISLMFNIPSAHSPMLETRQILDLELGVIDPRKAAEIVSVTFLHSILKGLQKSPKILNGMAPLGCPGVLTAADVSCVIIPDGCMGLPILAALEQGIPVIAVRENKNRMRNNLEEFPFDTGRLFLVDNYLEAVGVMSALKAGVSVESVRRPLKYTNVYEETASCAARETSKKPLKFAKGIDDVEEDLLRKEGSKAVR